MASIQSLINEINTAKETVAADLMDKFGVAETDLYDTSGNIKRLAAWSLDNTSLIKSLSSKFLPLAGGTMTGSITWEKLWFSSGQYIKARENAALRIQPVADNTFTPAISMKTSSGSWNIGTIGGTEDLLFTYDTDTYYSAGKNTYNCVRLENTTGTIAKKEDVTVFRNGYINSSSANNTLWDTNGILQCGVLPDGLADVSPTAYVYGLALTFTGSSGRFEIYASDKPTGQNAGLWYRTGWGTTKRAWAQLIDSSNISKFSIGKADQLSNARKLWGHDFDGTKDVTGDIGTTSVAIEGTMHCTNWFRSKGATGWYSTDYQSGIYMNDKSWIRTHGTTAGFSMNGLSVNGKVSIGAGLAYTHASYKLYVTGGNSYFGQALTVMGNATLAGNSVLISNGTLQVSKGDVTIAKGNLTATAGSIVAGSNITANNTMYATAFYESSDIRLKNVLNPFQITVEDLAKIPIFDFTWKADETSTIKTGTSAQEVQKILPNVVTEDNGTLKVNYGELGTIAGIQACKEIAALKERIKDLESKLAKFIKNEQLS